MHMHDGEVRSNKSVFPGNMAGHTKGCAARILNRYPRAHYVHCASHDLNLVLCHAAKQKSVFIMMENLKSAGKFFENSPKRFVI